MYDTSDSYRTNALSGARSAHFEWFLHDMTSFPAERLKVWKEMFSGRNFESFGRINRFCDESQQNMEIRRQGQVNDPAFQRNSFQCMLDSLLKLEQQPHILLEQAVQ